MSQSAEVTINSTTRPPDAEMALTIMDEGEFVDIEGEE